MGSILCLSGGNAVRPARGGDRYDRQDRRRDEGGRSTGGSTGDECGRRCHRNQDAAGSIRYQNHPWMDKRSARPRGNGPFTAAGARTRIAHSHRPILLRVSPDTG